MRQTVFLANRSFNIVQCFKCAVEFAMPTTLDETCHRDKQNFYCPNGHNQQYTQSLKEVLVQTQRDRDEALAARDRAEQEIRMLKDRAITGTCAFCHRHFKNVQRHMASKHKKATP